VRTLTGRGADVVVDSIGEVTWQESLRALSKKGRLVTCGATTGPQVVTDVRRLFWNQYTLMGSTMGNEAEYREAVRQLALGHLRPVIDRVYPLADARAAFERLERGEQMGKIGLEISPG
jgi:NADPH:quinone reductase-like Zn-dependent oxidoreductase